VSTLPAHDSFSRLFRGGRLHGPSLRRGVRGQRHDLAAWRTLLLRGPPRPRWVDAGLELELGLGDAADAVDNVHSRRCSSGGYVRDGLFLGIATVFTC